MTTPRRAGEIWPRFLAAVVLVFPACVRQSTPRVDPANAIIQPTNAIDSTSRAGSYSLDIYQPGTAQYDYHSTSIIQLIPNDSASRIDSAQVTAVLIATFAAVSGRQTIEATIKADSIRIVTQQLSVSPSSLQTQFVPVQIDRMTGRFSSPTSVTAECTQASVDLIFRGDEVIPAIRNSTTNQQFWTDTTLFELCRGGIRIQSTRVSRYDLDPSISASVSTTRIIRTTNLHMSGTGSQWQQPVQVTGEGTSIDTLVIAGTPPRLQQLSGASRLSLQFKSQLTTQHFVQTATASTIKRTP